MFRVVLVDTILFVLPFMIYAAYMVWVKGVAPKSAMAGAPVLWLIVAGFVVLIVGFFTLVDFTGGDRAGTYHPSVLEDGVIKLGGID